MRKEDKEGQDRAGQKEMSQSETGRQETGDARAEQERAEQQEAGQRTLRQGGRKRKREFPVTGFLAGLVLVLFLCTIGMGHFLLQQNRQSAAHQEEAQKKTAQLKEDTIPEIDTEERSQEDTETLSESGSEAVTEPVSKESGEQMIAIDLETEEEAETEEAENGQPSEKETEKAENGQSPEAETQQESVEEEKLTVAIDPGHQGSWVDMSELEPNGPGSSEMKAKATTGTQSSFGNLTEYELNLEVSLLLRTKLEERGYEVILTREDNDAAISNAERALLAYEEGGDILVRIHANGSDDPQTNGALAMVPSSDNVYVSDLAEDSYFLAQCILDAYCEKTSFQSLGIQYRDDMTGMNWSKIPVMILELGYMTNRSEDALMADPDMQNLMAEGIADGIDAYFARKAKETEKEAEGAEETEEEKESGEAEENRDTEEREEIEETEETEESGETEETEESGEAEETETETAVSAEAQAQLDETLAMVQESYLQSAQEQGEEWAVSIENLITGAKGDINGDQQMKSASVIKVFIMAAIYDRVCYPSSEDRRLFITETYDGELKQLITDMITVSDNTASNTLIERLGGGDAQAGMAIVNQFCRENGYTATHLGRKFLEENPTDDNYTSVNDCCRLLASIYEGTCVSPEASAKMYEYLKAQTRRWKIPAGISSQTAMIANKTGELAGDYGDYVENDIALVVDGDAAYVLCVMSADLLDNGTAMSRISGISGLVYEQLT